jgi:Putative MetA-pathway of phenol degradation
MILLRTFILLFAIVLPAAVLAGPPYVSDDPEPTDYQHYEIYLFDQAGGGHAGVNGSYGIDFNYGAMPDLQLTAVLPVVYEREANGISSSGVGNIELAAKYRFLHKEDFGWDVAFFPRVSVPSVSNRVGDQHASLQLPLWLEHDADPWSTFGGGGCEINHGDDAKDFCLLGWALTRQITPHLQLGAEIVSQSADTKEGRATTQIGAGMRYDLNENLHVLAYAGPGLQNIAETQRYAWYTSLLLTF